MLVLLVKEFKVQSGADRFDDAGLPLKRVHTKSDAAARLHTKSTIDALSRVHTESGEAARRRVRCERGITTKPLERNQIKDNNKNKNKNHNRNNHTNKALFFHVFAGPRPHLL